MIRLVFKRMQMDSYTGLKTEQFETLAVECPELEAILNRGGRGPEGYDVTAFMGYATDGPAAPPSDTKAVPMKAVLGVGTERT